MSQTPPSAETGLEQFCSSHEDVFSLKLLKQTNPNPVTTLQHISMGFALDAEPTIPPELTHPYGLFSPPDTGSSSSGCPAFSQPLAQHRSYRNKPLKHPSGLLCLILSVANLLLPGMRRLPSPRPAKGSKHPSALSLDLQ